MKRVYWRPQKCSATSLALVALLAVTGIAVVELVKVNGKQRLADEKTAAAQLAADCYDVIRHERVSRGYAIDPELDPTQSGMIGLATSPVTSIAGHLKSKQASVNPNFAAAIVQMLDDAGVQRGDQIAVGYTGSLPALNVALCAACESMGVKPIIVASATSSQFGANYPDLFWIDMERILREQGLIECRASAVSVGGYQDRGLQFSNKGLSLIRAAIDRSGIALLSPADFADSIEQRMDIYHRIAAGRPIKAYVNIGGGTVSVGKRLGKEMYRSGVNLEPPAGAGEIDSVMTRFAGMGVPVIHLVDVQRLAKQHGLPAELATSPVVGQGELFVRRRTSRVLAAFVLVIILLALRSIMLTDWSHRFMQRLCAWTGRSIPAGQEPEWMV